VRIYEESLDIEFGPSQVLYLHIATNA